MPECLKWSNHSNNVHRGKWWRVCDYLGLSQYTVGVLAEKQRGLSKDVWDDDQTQVVGTKQLNATK